MFTSFGVWRTGFWGLRTGFWGWRTGFWSLKTGLWGLDGGVLERLCGLLLFALHRAVDLQSHYFRVFEAVVVDDFDGDYFALTDYYFLFYIIK
jgi:hypothetical protein